MAVYNLGRIDGLSAYEVAKKNGYEGTEQEWLASLKGEQGIQGEQGEPGATGSAGAPGKDGANGKDGVSSTVTVNTNTDTEYTLNITDVNGTITTPNLKGPKGDAGEGGGGIAELPIASADTLGGIKVGEGLEITEDGILSALGGGTGVTGEVTALYKGAFSTLNSSLALSDNINNYDILVVNTYIKGSGGHKLKTTTTVVVDQISYSGNEEYVCFSNTLASSMQYCYTVRFGFDTSGDTLLVGNIQKSPDYGTNEVGIDSVYGIKLGGGTGGGSYTETDLISSPVDYAQGDSSGTTIAQDLALLDDVANYDEIVFCVARNQDGNKLLSPSENSYHVSNLVYNNSDTQASNGSRLTIHTTMVDKYSCGLWFKDGRTLRIHNTFASGAVNSTDKFRFISIKGIKY